MTQLSLDALINHTGIDQQELEPFFLQAVEAWHKDAGFVLPPAARELFARNGSNTEVVLLGTTTFSRVFMREASSRVCVTAVVDDFRTGKGFSFENLPIITSDALSTRKDRHTLIAINGCRDDYARRYFNSLCRRHGISVLTFEQAMRLLDIRSCIDHRVDDWAPHICAHASEYQHLAATLADEHSRFTLFSVLLAQLICNAEWRQHAAQPYSTLYFRSGVWSAHSQERFVDCGASTGESSTALIDTTNGTFERIWMIEPDRINIETLRQFIYRFDANGRSSASGQISLHPCALGEQDDMLPFSHQGGHSGMLLAPTASSSFDLVPVRRLDDVLDDSPTLIKMDIEGAELAALKGASEHIIRSRPKMAISAYHRASDLLDITDFIRTLRDDYRLGIRHHTEDRWDTCLYFY